MIYMKRLVNENREMIRKGKKRRQNRRQNRGKIRSGKKINKKKGIDEKNNNRKY